MSVPGPTGMGLTALCLSLCCVPVIEVASGEYGDLNPVLFEAVQGGLCSEEGKKNSSDESDSFCHSTGYNVCCTRTRKGAHTHTHTHAHAHAHAPNTQTHTHKHTHAVSYLALLSIFCFTYYIILLFVLFSDNS